jgi:hypothetical protein
MKQTQPNSGFLPSGVPYRTQYLHSRHEKYNMKKSPSRINVGRISEDQLETTHILFKSTTDVSSFRFW